MATHYRTNKYGESVKVELYCCGTCGNYEFEREDRDNYCSCYRCYYSVDDSCSRNWEKSSEVTSTGCYLTTACCTHKGLADDCKELTVLRQFRDTILVSTEAGKELVKTYYTKAPLIVKKIEDSPKREEILEGIYNEICEMVRLLDADTHQYAQEVTTRYLSMVQHVEESLKE